MEIPVEIAEHRIAPSEIPSLRTWISLTRELAARGLVRPDIGEIAELLVAVAVDGTRARRGNRDWDVRGHDGGLIQVKAVWHLPHRRRQNLGNIGQTFAGRIWVVEFGQDLRVGVVRALEGRAFAGSRLRVRDALAGKPVDRWDVAAELLGLS